VSPQNIELAKQKREISSYRRIPSASYNFKTKRLKKGDAAFNRGARSSLDTIGRGEHGGCIWESHMILSTLGPLLSDLGCWSLYAFDVQLLISMISHVF
jgi:hypothetical protein